MPLVALDFAFRGGASQDPADKPGVANMTTSLIDEGAGDLDSKAFHERIAAKAIELSFSANRDQTSGVDAHAVRPSRRGRRAGAALSHRSAFRHGRHGSYSRADHVGTAPRDDEPQRDGDPALVGDRLSRPSLRPAGPRHARIGPHHHLGRPQGLCPADIRPRHPEDRDRRRHRSRRRRPAGRQGIRRTAGEEHARLRAEDEPAGARAEDLGRARRSTVGAARRRRRHRRATIRTSSRPSSSITCSAAARSRHGFTARCARRAASPIRCSAP